MRKILADDESANSQACDFETAMQRSIALPLLGQIATALYLPLNWTVLAEAEADSGNVESALAITTDELAEIRRTGQQCFMTEMHRLRGELLCKSDSEDKSEAEKAFLQAIKRTRDQKPKTFELRAALSLARLTLATAARDTLAPAVAALTDDQDLPEIRQAVKLLPNIDARLLLSR
jgi:predicted ATPase